MNNDGMNDNPTYERLLGVLRGFLEEARSFNAVAPRTHRFRCVECQAQEKWDKEKGRVVVNGVGETLSVDSFLIVSVDREPYWRDATVRMKTAYEYICPDCGVWVKESFDEPLGY